MIDIDPRGLDAASVSARLGFWIGSFCRDGHAVVRAGFRHLVLCAEECQPPDASYPPILRLWRCPIDDGSLLRPEQRRVRSMATQLATLDSVEEPILFTCAAGINRSALVLALTAYRRTGEDMGRIVRRIRERRPGALSNPRFVEYLRRVGRGGQSEPPTLDPSELARV